MKLHVCECGGTPHISFNIEGKNLFTVSCPTCGTSTPEYDDLKAAQRIWNLWCWKMEYWDTEDAAV
jgi:hypothetical protein